MIPSIAAGQRNFASVCQHDENGKLLSGQISISYGLKKNLQEIYSAGKNDEKLVRKLIMDCHHRKENRAITSQSAKLIMKFYDFTTDSRNDLFFIRSGFEVLGLFKRTSGYFYDDKEAYDGYCHRFNFERVRDATPVEASYLKTVKYPNGGTVPAVTETPLSPPVDPRDAEIADLKAKLAAANAEAQRLGELLSRIRSMATLA